MIHTQLTQLLGIDYPIILAPMFLVSNVAMLTAAQDHGIAGCVPSLNYRTPEELKKALLQIRNHSSKPFGVNLIVNKSNTQLQKHLSVCLDSGVDFIITSLGSPKLVIAECKKKNIKVFCDVVEETYARKVEDLGADGIIAVNSAAGGHAGNLPAHVLVPMLKKACKVPIISAGGVGTGAGLLATLELGADGVSIGSPFIATKESPVSDAYKQAVVDYGAKDIMMTTKLSGTPCSVIKTPYVEKIGLEQNFLEKILSQNKGLKKYIKMLTYYKGMKLLERAALSASYQTVWVAGPSIEFVKEISTVGKVIQRFIQEYKQAQIKSGKLADQ